MWPGATQLDPDAVRGALKGGGLGEAEDRVLEAMYGENVAAPLIAAIEAVFDDDAGALRPSSP